MVRNLQFTPQVSTMPWPEPGARSSSWGCCLGIRVPSPRDTCCCSQAISQELGWTWRGQTWTSTYMGAWPCRPQLCLLFLILIFIMFCYFFNYWRECIYCCLSLVFMYDVCVYVLVCTYVWSCLYGHWCSCVYWGVCVFFVSFIFAFTLFLSCAFCWVHWYSSISCPASSVLKCVSLPLCLAVSVFPIDCSTHFCVSWLCC